MSVNPEELEWALFATGHSVCPVCGDQIPVPVEAASYVDDEDGLQRLVTQPVMTELYSHAWTHEVSS